MQSNGLSLPRRYRNRMGSVTMAFTPENWWSWPRLHADSKSKKVSMLTKNSKLGGRENKEELVDNS